MHKPATCTRTDVLNIFFSSTLNPAALHKKDIVIARYVNEMPTFRSHDDLLAEIGRRLTA